MKESKEILIDQIRIDGGTQMRSEIDTITVSDYAERIDDLPPSVLFFDGTTYWLADGFHRWHAHRKAGKKKMQCDVHKGTQRDAILFAAGANHSHGLRRTNADKRKAVATLLADEEWGKRSANWIAEQCAVSHTFVSELKSKNQPATLQVECKDGRARPATASRVKVDDVDPDEFFPKANSNGKHVEVKPEKKPEPTVVKDEEGQEIKNEKVAELFQRRQEITELMNGISRLKSQVVKACESNDPLYVHLTLSQFEADCKNLYAALKFARPHAVCPYCGGLRGCKVCKKSGLVGEVQFKNYTPEDLKV